MFRTLLRRVGLASANSYPPRAACPRKRTPRPRQSLYVEALEERNLLSGTVQLLKDVGSPTNFMVSNGTLFFTTNWSLYKSDGTSAGTVLVKNINPGGPASNPSGLTDANGTLYFEATDATGPGLWKSDGTTAGTVVVKYLGPKGPVIPVNLAAVNSTVFFLSQDAAYGQELWETDGTSGGTVLVKDINPGTAGSKPANLTNVNGTLFFTANDGVHGYELWKSDGTAAGTVMVDDINLGSAHSYPYNIVGLNGMALFTANDGVHGRELWKTDGTTAGTVLVADINPGSASSAPERLGPGNNSAVNFNGMLYFEATDGTHGQELWQSDGTASGTAMVADINPGAADSNPGLMTAFNGSLYFRANDGMHGQAPWVFTPASAPSSFASAALVRSAITRPTIQSGTILPVSALLPRPEPQDAATGERSIAPTKSGEGTTAGSVSPMPMPRTALDAFFAGAATSLEESTFELTPSEEPWLLR